MKNNKTGMSKGKVAAGVAGLAAVGAGAYYLLGPKAKAHQKKAKLLLEKMKKEIKKEVKNVKEISVPLYHKAVDAISDKYAEKYLIYEKDIKSIAKKLKDELKKKE